MLNKKNFYPHPLFSFLKKNSSTQTTNHQTKKRMDKSSSQEIKTKNETKSQQQSSGRLKLGDFVWRHSEFEMPGMARSSFPLIKDELKNLLAGHSCVVSNERASDYEYEEWQDVLKRQKEGKIPSGKDWVYEEPKNNQIISIPGINGTMFIKSATHQAWVFCTLGPLSETIDENQQAEQVVYPFYDTLDKCNFWDGDIDRQRLCFSQIQAWSTNSFQCLVPIKIDLEKWLKSHVPDYEVSGSLQYEKKRRGATVREILDQNPVDGKTVVLDTKYWNEGQKNVYEYAKTFMIPSQFELFKAYSSVMTMPSGRPHIAQCREAKPEYLHEMWVDNYYSLRWETLGQCLVMTGLTHSKFQIFIHANGDVNVKTFPRSLVGALWPRLLAEMNRYIRA